MREFECTGRVRVSGLNGKRDFMFTVVLHREVFEDFGEELIAFYLFGIR